MKYIYFIAIIIIIISFILVSRKEREIQIKNVILYVTKPIENNNTSENVIDEDDETSWKPQSQEDKTYVLGFDFNQQKKVSRVKIISSKTRSNNSINEMKIRMPNGELVYDTAKSIKSPSGIEDNEPQIINIKLDPPVECDKLLLEFLCDTINETACDVREVMFYEKKMSLF